MHWQAQSSPAATRREDLLLVLFSSLLGHPFAWATQQNGRLIHDVLPIKGHEFEQLGSSSESPLTWHTEDAFHPLRGDFLSFACLRNPCAASTTIGHADSLDLPDKTKSILSEDRFIILPDESHRARNNSVTDAATFASVDEMQINPPHAICANLERCNYRNLIPYADLLLAVVRRTKAGMSPFAPDKKHLHHRLLGVGHSHRRSVLIMYLWAALFSGTVVSLSLVRTDLIVLVGLTGVAVLVLMFITMPSLRPARLRNDNGVEHPFDIGRGALPGAPRPHGGARPDGPDGPGASRPDTPLASPELALARGHGRRS